LPVFPPGGILAAEEDGMETRTDAHAGPQISPRVRQRVALGRAIRAEADRVVATRGALAEAAAWVRARAPGQSTAERSFREAVAARVSRMFAFVGIDRQH
jgi:hypothetical protein